MGSHRHLRRSDLFLVRMWTEEAVEGSDRTEWRGKVQRVVDGESRQFDSWQSLVDTLLAMLSGAGGSGPRAGTGAGQAEHENKQSTE